MVLIVGLILIGILLLVLEILILPGLIAGIIGAVFLIIAIAWMYADYGSTAGNYTLLSTLLLTFLAIWGSFKSKAWSRFGHKETLEGKMNDIARHGIAEGEIGTTLSALRPSGTVLIRDAKVEGFTNGEILNAGTKVKVVRVLPGKILVEAIPDAS
jgi:membrane-bound ClpP family serine protease